MMPRPAPSLTRFVHRLHRRLILLRLLESAAIGLACAAVLAVLVLPVLLMSEKPALPVVTALLPLGAMIGILWRMLRRPGVIDAASEADRQLRLADLLTTAWMIARNERTPDDPFERAVLLSADARAAGLSPSSIVLNRLGARAWAGVGLTSALAITLTLLSANPIVSQADAMRQVALNDITSPLKESSDRSSSSMTGSRSAPIVADHPSQEENGFNPARRTTQVAGAGSDSTSDQAQAADPSGSGGGAGTSRSQPDKPLANTSSASADPKGTGSTPGGGGGALSASGVSNDGSSSLSAGAARADRAVPPWMAPGWSASRSEAANAVRSGSVPAQYHDLIRSYFDREGDRP